MALKTITVRELMALLQDQEPDARIVFASDYGDRSHTMQAIAIDGEVEEVKLRKTAYSDSGFEVVREDDVEDMREYDKLDSETFLLLE